MTTKILRRALFGFAVAAGTFTVVTHSWAAPPPTNATVFVNLADPDYCIGVYGGATSDLSSLVLWQCDGSANQTWVTDNSFSANTFFYMNDSAATSMCASLYGGNVANGTPLILWTCDGGYDQAWQFISQPVAPPYSGHAQCYTISNMAAFEDMYNPDQVIGVDGGNIRDGADIVLWSFFNDPVNHPDQYWCVFDGPV